MDPHYTLHPRHPHQDLDLCQNFDPHHFESIQKAYKELLETGIKIHGEDFDMIRTKRFNY